MTDRAALAALAVRLAPTYRSGDIVWCPADGVLRNLEALAISSALAPGLELHRPVGGDLAGHAYVRRTIRALPSTPYALAG